ncbi:MAG TPA: PorP/SprF family type IX secretion system membrane protein [Ktedonobacteraceae bacterium]|jgi:type IX secretion system PorP/SprF family membrane protein|nr:PorP/SprF family type IX secretion system membrane protein [Bacteroidia bacterium]HEV7235234.1 PorP/SprF family type IX secretion system membrane protein [Ktedonobacteraceae bacterium]
MRKNLLKQIVAAFCIVACSQVCRAQDYHLSQYDIAPLYMNPALAGMYLGEKGDFRVMANYRSQWQKLQSKPYTTSALAFDKPMGRFGVGGYIVDNLAGLSNYNTFGFMVGGAYRITSEKSKFHILTTGLQIGMLNKKYSDNDLLFTEQYYSNRGLDPNTPTGESFQKFSSIKFDVNMGIYYKYKNDFKKFNPFAGFSINHVNRPDQSTTGTVYRMPMRFNLSGGTDIYISSLLNLTPSVLFMYQGGAREIVLGVLEYYHINANYQLVSGLSYRVQDAVIIQLGIKQGSSVFRMSYDIITSPLKAYAGSRGAIEMGIVYTGMNK